jgi:hypothetical protein
MANTNAGNIINQPHNGHGNGDGSDNISGGEQHKKSEGPKTPEGLCINLHNYF